MREDRCPQTTIEQLVPKHDGLQRIEAQIAAFAAETAGLKQQLQQHSSSRADDYGPPSGSGTINTGHVIFPAGGANDAAIESHNAWPNGDTSSDVVACSNNTEPPESSPREKLTLRCLHQPGNGG